jgi:hypothetical protein
LTEEPSEVSGDPPDAPAARPSFARHFPADPELDALVVAFEEGDYRKVRREAPALAARAKDPEVAKSARELRARLDPDPLAVYLLALPFVLLLFLSVWFLWHARG